MLFREQQQQQKAILVRISYVMKVSSAWAWELDWRSEVLKKLQHVGFMGVKWKTQLQYGKCRIKGLHVCHFYFHPLILNLSLTVSPIFELKYSKERVFKGACQYFCLVSHFQPLQMFTIRMPTSHITASLLFPSAVLPDPLPFILLPLLRRSPKLRTAVKIIQWCWWVSWKVMWQKRWKGSEGLMRILVIRRRSMGLWGLCHQQACSLLQLTSLQHSFPQSWNNRDPHHTPHLLFTLAHTFLPQSSVELTHIDQESFMQHWDSCFIFLLGSKEGAGLWKAMTFLLISRPDIALTHSGGEQQRQHNSFFLII